MEVLVFRGRDRTVIIFVDRQSVGWASDRGSVFPGRTLGIQWGFGLSTVLYQAHLQLRLRAIADRIASCMPQNVGSGVKSSQCRIPTVFADVGLCQALWQPHA